MLTPFLLYLAAPVSAVPDGLQLQESETCYTITNGDKPLGVTWQQVIQSQSSEIPTWVVVVHQRLNDGAFDLRDEFTLRQSDLAPLYLVSRKAGKEHVRVDYQGEMIRTLRPDAAPVELPKPEQVWDGNLWGLTFAALPLAEGAHFTLPYYHYDKGMGQFTLDVVGTEQVEGRAAWIVLADSGNGRKVRYAVAQDDRTELGYSAGPFAQRLGGDCSALALAG